ncbi:LysR family transcriptional regulator [Selenihalanaerobacter shriftii]|uniref:DNA-binding transcriptional regulator, LysR family n=1 Tax=Selenihalanaerobacter shriftii TaxID=142842 RepID=A0A1T4JUU5_9FIRM|nr:LysR family transcriptional regulator [Selenihalanaerobacter shriftii]SJZ33837.1 DNA-binding transcriptional regulator, LysR family [Selenihalanaerobacter shriftii]
MKIYQFKIFNTVTQVKSFSKAANLLYLSQPAISKHIKSMEEYYGTRLFNRTSQGVNLTKAGRTVYEYGKKLLETHDNLEKEIDKHLNLENLNLIVGASVTPGEYLLPCTIWTFKDKHPKIDIQLKVNHTEEIIQEVLNNKVSIGIVEGEVPPETNLNTKKIMYDELKFIASPLKFKKDIISLEELKESPLILLNESFGIRQKFNQFIDSNNLKIDDLNIITEMDSITAIKSAVESGLGVSIVSHSSIKKEIYQDIIKTFDINNTSKDKLRVKFKLIHQNQTDQPNIITRFITFLSIQNEQIFC